MLVSDPEELSTIDPFTNSAHDRGYTDADVSLRNHIDVLVVDDNRLVADTTTAILKLFGFSAITAYDGATALRLAVETNPDILLSDVMMPVLNGVDLAIAIREIRPETAIVLFSGQAATNDILRSARQKGHFFEILSKPIPPEELVRHLHCLRRT
ncbi:MAG: response regulator [Acidobacteriota bacterium]